MKKSFLGIFIVIIVMFAAYLPVLGNTGDRVTVTLKRSTPSMVSEKKSEQTSQKTKKASVCKCLCSCNCVVAYLALNKLVTKLQKQNKLLKKKAKLYRWKYTMRGKTVVGLNEKIKKLKKTHGKFMYKKNMADKEIVCLQERLRKTKKYKNLYEAMQKVLKALNASK